jgi:uncharacterized protein (TIRG00374 family)
VTASAVGRVFRVLVAAVLTAYMLFRSDPAAVLRAAAHADASYVLLAMMLTLVDRTLMAWRWLALLCIVDSARRPPLGRLLEIFFVSTFLGTFLPASVGGDAVRAYRLSRDRVSGADAVASVFMDRMLGVASLLVLGTISLLLARDLADNRPVLAALALTGTACLVTMLLIFSERTGIWCASLVSALPVERLNRAGHAIVGSVQRYARFHLVLLKVLAASVGVQIVRVIQAYCLGRALGIDAGLPVYLAFIPLILLIMLLPITINGLGTSQAAFVWFFARTGVANAPAFALSVLFVGLGIVGNLPGGLLYAFGQSSSKAVS